MKLKLLFVSTIGILFSSIYHAQITITEVYYDTPYNERLGLNPNNPSVIPEHHKGEFIELYNYSNQDISLDGWYVQDYLGTYMLPSDKTIKAGGFFLVAYGKNSLENYFPDFFPTTQGQEGKIVYQNVMLLRNKIETIRVGTFAYKGQMPILSDEITVGKGANAPSNYSPSNGNSAVFYDVPSVQWQSTAQQYGKPVHSYIDATPNPLGATYKPATQNLQDILLPIYLNNYSFLDWSDNVNLLLDQKCPIVIQKTEQVPSGTFSNDTKCFSYDTSGNSLSTSNCNGSNGPGSGSVNNLTTDQLDEIKNSIVISPNPTKASDSYNVTITWSGPALNKINNIQVFNSSGTTVYAFAPGLGVNTTTFNLQNQLPGAFVANFILTTGQVVSKNILKW